MLEYLLDRFGDATTLTAAGVVVGVLFGMAAQHSRFCLRAATIELSEGHFGPRLFIWLMAFSAAVFSVQTFVATGMLDVAEARPLSGTGSMSGAIVGGLMFGSGMILARGCASRLLILSATGNLRAIVTGLVLTLVAQASLRGALTPAREGLASLWLVPGGHARDLLALTGISSASVAAVSLVAVVMVFLLARRAGLETSRVIAAGGVGIAVGFGWFATFFIAQASFDLVQISSVTFTGPSTDTLMGLVNTATLPMGFGIGLVPGVFFGAAAMALMAHEIKIERFGPDAPMERYLVGACLMGFGSMLAGGCAVGAGMSGGAIFALTAWVAVFCMWLGAMGTHVALGRLKPLSPAAP